MASRLGIGKAFKTAFRGRPQAQQPAAFEAGQSTDLTQFQQPWSEWLKPADRWQFARKFGNS